MAEPFGIRVDGGRQFRSTVKRAVGDLGDLKATHKEAADLVAREAKPDAPTGKTLKLQGSVRAAGTASAAIIRAGGARVRYAGVQHFGWPARNIKAQPFITEAAQRTEPQWADIYADGVQTILNRIKGV